MAETLTCEQSFRPFAEALERNGWNVREESEIEADSTRYALVLVLPPRQREEARALFARAVALTAPGGRVVACQSNNEGARSGEADLRQLTGLAGSLTKHHCRTYWTAPLPADTDATLQARWAALDAPRKILDGRFVSRPGVFAWDRIDPASALLVEHLPTTLAGHGADLGAGFGYLSAEVLARCPKVTVLDLYEAQARADAGAAQSAGHHASGAAALPLARCHRRAGGALRFHRQQSAFPYTLACRPPGYRPTLHRGGCTGAAPGRATVVGGQPAFALRTGAQRKFRAGARGCRARWFQADLGHPRPWSARMKLVKHIANLGYGSRKQVTQLFRQGAVTDAQGEVLYADDQVEHDAIRIDGEPLDPPPGFSLLLHKPGGYTCSTKDTGRLIYELLPPRFRSRAPVLAPVGRLDRETSGMLLMTDDGALLHRIISPKSALDKVYDITLAEDLRGDEAALFASGSLLLEGETKPLLPAELEVLGPREARLTLHEGRYHQVRRMFAAAGNHVVALHRSRIGGLSLDGLPSGQWRALEASDLEVLFGRGAAA